MLNDYITLKMYIESIWLEIKLNNSAPIIIGFIYKNPNEKTEWIDIFSSMLDAILLDQEYMLLDFNFDLLKPNNHWLDKKLHYLVSHNLLPPPQESLIHPKLY